ncbi:MAG: PstS family phosphate ABC transporter substrate-binding protein [Planctomycetales bacterium]|nr:PstS family phosphate ABC transporter substrate-binding protein [Planctomycetales bacterium]
MNAISRSWFLAQAVGLMGFILLGTLGCGPSTPPAGGGMGGTTTSGGTSTDKPDANAGPLSGKVDIDGSSTVFPVTEAVAEEFRNQVSKDVKVTVGISGTGGGFKKFVRGEIDISDASRPILNKGKEGEKGEIDLAKENKIEYIELPICFDALTVAVNKDADWVDSITVAELKKIWEPGAEGKITHWNQIRKEWPNEKLVLFGAGTDSGTFDYFTEAINGKAKASRGDYTPSEDDNTLVQGIEGSKFALGYLPYAYYEPNKAKLKALKIDWKADDKLGAIEPSAENVLNGTYNPLSRPLFIYVNRKSAERPEVKSFVEFYLKNVKELATEVKYLPLPDKAYEMALERFSKLKTGTSFGGEQAIGITIEEVLQREAK